MRSPITDLSSHRPFGTPWWIVPAFAAMAVFLLVVLIVAVLVDLAHCTGQFLAEAGGRARHWSAGGDRS